ncbi:class I SAM-dependent methyltransferase [Hylemonella sp. W303a]|uniref:class I SAM-dependent methyltransferase n=1 Tax=Hylemonella sp. W303a TaxID=3389873 RepID=UPI00396B4627
MSNTTQSLTTHLSAHLTQALAEAGGWLGFDDFMSRALYTPGLGYYANDLRKLGLMPGASGGGSDFVTAPELSPLFGQALAAQIGEALERTGTDQIWEFGAGSGALALQLLRALRGKVRRYTIVDVSGALRARQQETLQEFADQADVRIDWATTLPEAMHGVVVGNEVLDAMPVKLLARKHGVWQERGVAEDQGRFVWADRTTALRPPVAIAGEHDYLTETHAQAEAFLRTVAGKLLQGAREGRPGAAFFIDYGFPEAEYYHPQRHMGTVMCHRAHQSDADPLSDVGLKDITAHVNFTGIALAGQEAGLEVLGYTSQGRFLFNCGLARLMAPDEAAADTPEALARRAQASKLVMEHEMGELFKVIGFATLDAVGRSSWGDAAALGFAHGDRTHAL